MHVHATLNEQTANTREIVSAALRDAIAQHPHFTSEAPKVLSNELFLALRESVLVHMASLGHAYHNDRHVERVVAQATLLAEAAALSGEETQLLTIAALFHDYGHAGNSYRQLVTTVDRHDLSNEEYAVLCADAALAEHFSIPQRITLQGLILATSYGQRERERIPEGIREAAFRPYLPVTKLEKLLAFADISSGLVDFATFDEDNAALTREFGKNSLPKDSTSYCNEMLEFLAYLSSALKDVEGILPRELVLHYRQQLSSYQNEIRRLSDNPDAAEATHMIRAFRQTSATRS